MAEGGGNWWDTWLQSAKQTSTNVYEFMKKDLDEFSQTVQHETKSVVSSAAGALKEKLNIDTSESTANKVKRSVSTFLGTVSQALTPTREENEDEICIIHNDEPVIMDRLQAQLYALQNDPKTYLEDPVEAKEDYEEWMQSFDLETKSTELSDIMITNVEVQELYTKLVPAEVSHVLFWTRYFFKLYQLLLNEERKRVIMERVTQPVVPDDIVWDDVEEDAASPPKEEDMPDHVADKLLEDYEKECRSRKRTVKDTSPKTSETSIEISGGFGDGSVNATKYCPDPLVAESVEDKQINLSSKDHPAKLGSTAINSVESRCHEEISKADLSTASKPKVPEPAQGHITSNPTSLEGESTAISATTSPEDTNSLAEITDPQLVTREKGDLVVVGHGISNRTSPASSNKEGSNDDEWEKDFDLEVTEDEVKKAKEIIKVTSSTVLNETEEEWENWE